MTVTVSVIVPAYNHGRYIARCLDSVAADPFPSKELVIIDDGSTDDTRAQVEAWTRDHDLDLRVVFTPRGNRGLSPTLSELLGMATGELVLPLASDDELIPGAITVLANALQAPGVDAVFGDARVVDELGATVDDSLLFGYRRMSRDRLQRDVARELIVSWGVAGPILMYRRGVVVALGGYDESLLIEDWDLYLRLARSGRLRFIDATVGVYRIHGGNTSMDPGTWRRRHQEEQALTRRHARRFTGRYRLLLAAKYLYRSELVSGRPDRPASGMRRAITLPLQAFVRLLRDA